MSQAECHVTPIAPLTAKPKHIRLVRSQGKQCRIPNTLSLSPLIMSQAAVLGPSSSTPEGVSPSYSSEEDVSSSSSSSSSSFSGPSTPPNMHQNTIDPSAKWLVQKFGGTSVGKFAVRIAEDIVSCVFSF
jgi:hypothetical protein